MKKSMFALFGCALVAGSVMAASVDGNNTAVVIQKDAVYSKSNYQFLIVPVKGFDITGQGATEEITLAELLPPALFDDATIVYEATPAGAGTTYTLVEEDDGSKNWMLIIDNMEPRNANEVTYKAGTPFWLQTPDAPTKDVVFCGEILSQSVSITPKAGEMQLFGNATSETVKISDIAGTFKSNDTIFVVKQSSNDYDHYIWSATQNSWTKSVPGKVKMQKVDDSDILPAGAAAYFYRAQ